MSEYIALKLEKREWTSKTTGATGSTYCFNNQKNSNVEFGGHSISLSILDGSTQQVKEPKVFGWVNEMTDAQYEAFIEEYGDTEYIHTPTKEMITQQEYDELGVEDTTQPVASQFQLDEPYIVIELPDTALGCFA